MDHNALYRNTPLFDSRAMKALPEAERQVPIAVMIEGGETAPADAKVVRPYLCKRC